jgi:hypothetical protein
MPSSSASPARFRRVPVGLLPEAVKVNGTIFRVGPVNSPPGPGWLPADLLAARNVASAHLSMGRQLLRLTAGVKPGDFKELLKDLREDFPDRRTSFRSSDTALVAHEITCQNGAEVVSAIFDQLTAANLTGRQVNAGPVSEDNAHATAFAAAHQLANEVLRGEPLSITGADLDRLQELVDGEAWAAAGRRGAGGGTPARRGIAGDLGTGSKLGPALDHIGRAISDALDGAAIAGRQFRALAAEAGETLNSPADLMEFMAREYHYTPAVFANLTDRQILDMVSRTLQRKLAERKDAAQTPLVVTPPPHRTDEVQPSSVADEAALPAGVAQRRQRMTVERANDKAMKLARKLRAGFFALSERQQAKQIGCSWATWKKTEFYAKAQARRPAGKRSTVSSPKAESLTAAREAVTGEGDKEEVLQQLIAEQEADKEPSPLESDAPGRPRKVHSRKRL